MVIQQDTVRSRNIEVTDSFRVHSDTTPVAKIIRPVKNSVINSIAVTATPQQTVIDTTSVCRRNSISDVTYYDSTNVIINIESKTSGRFPFLFTEKNLQTKEAERLALVKVLHQGKELPFRPLHEDWVILVIVFVAFLFSVTRNALKGFLPRVTRFFLFRGINDPSSRDIGGLFHWQSTILNLISFLVAGLFVYIAASWYELIPAAGIRILYWLTAVGVLIVAVTLRHFACIIVGNISDQREAFREYLIGIYQSYRFSALFLFFIVILIEYTVVIPANVSILAGFIVFETHVPDTCNQAYNNFYKQEYINILFDFIPLCAGISACCDIGKIFYRPCLDWRALLWGKT